MCRPCSRAYDRARASRKAEQTALPRERGAAPAVTTIQDVVRNVEARHDAGGMQSRKARTKAAPRGTPVTVSAEMSRSVDGAQFGLFLARLPGGVRISTTVEAAPGEEGRLSVLAFSIDWPGDAP